MSWRKEGIKTMGWQGKMRHSKGYKFFLMLPEDVRKGRKFIQASSWRDNVMVWIAMESPIEGETLLRMNRRTADYEWEIQVGFGRRGPWPVGRREIRP
jgi:hypothetical protein